MHYFQLSTVRCESCCIMSLASARMVGRGEKDKTVGTGTSSAVRDMPQLNPVLFPLARQCTGTQVDPLSKVHAAFCTRLGLDPTRVQFMVDGDVVNLTHSANDMDLENDDVIVCRMALSAAN